MAQFMLLLGGVDIDSHRGNREPGSLIDKYAKWVAGLNQSNSLRQGEKLRDGEGFRVGQINGRIIDGPFTETKETISSFFIIEAKDYTEALSIAKECPAVTDQNGYVEVREVTSCPSEPLV